MNPSTKKFLVSLAVSAALLAACGPRTPGPGPDPEPTDAGEAAGFVCADHPGMGAKVADVTADLDFRECSIRAHESAAGNLLVDALFWALKNNNFSADITTAANAKQVRFYMENSGTAQFKALLPKGELCETGYISKTAPGQGDLATGKSFTDATVPFRNNVVLVSMAPSKLRQVLERSFAINETASPALDYPNKDGSFLLISSNVKVSVDFADYANKAQKVSKPTTTRQGALITAITIDGQPLDLNDQVNLITFATSNFVAGIDIQNGTIKPGTEAGKGAGVAAGFTSDYFSNDQLPATNTFQILDEGKDGALPTTFTETEAIRKYFSSNTTLTGAVDGRFVYANQTRQLDLCL